MTQGKGWGVILAVVGVLLIGALLLSGCGDDSDADSFVLGACRLDAADCRLQ
jgi:hypothetical protein